MTANHEPINSSRFHWEKSVNFSVERTEGKFCREQNTFSTRAALQMGSDFWKFSCCSALQHLIPFWWFERRDDNRRWHDLEGKQKFSLQKQCKIKHKGEYGSYIIHPAALAEIAGLSRVRPKCCCFFFKSIITPSPHNLTSVSQQNTSKPRLHKRGTHQSLRGSTQTLTRTQLAVPTQNTNKNALLKFRKVCFPPSSPAFHFENAIKSYK